MGYMLLATQFCSGHMLQGRTKAYRIIDFIGRWSMIDVFMVSILIALVHFGQFANVRANVGPSASRRWWCSPCSPSTPSTPA
ncbi:paraquat-inducible protein A [Acidocella sp. MX-AZ03]|nr:paraquat-inducible protein A [Acidocella sp. MX-AZ03]WBO61109.1 paraquat-inducible protein A [Acidocella sp. MX-AZ03]